MRRSSLWKLSALPDLAEPPAGAHANVMSENWKLLKTIETMTIGQNKSLAALARVAAVSLAAWRA